VNLGSSLYANLVDDIVGSDDLDEYSADLCQTCSGTELTAS